MSANRLESAVVEAPISHDPVAFIDFFNTRATSRDFRFGESSFNGSSIFDESAQAAWVSQMLQRVERKSRDSLYRFAGKRLADVVISFIWMSLMIPIFVLIATAIKLDSPGPVFVRQRRLGRFGKVITVFQFRTMHASDIKLAMFGSIGTGKRVPPGPPPDNYAAYLRRFDSDPRISRVGKFIRRFSLDTLPMMFNVFRGDLSLVGPIAQPYIATHSSAPLRGVILQARPGLTGPAHLKRINGAQASTLQRIEVDYVLNVSLWRDLKIFARTCVAVFVSYNAI